MSADPEAALASVGMIGGIVLLVVTIAIFWIGLAIAVKRWHDRGKSGWWILVPIYGFILTAFLPGTAGPNRFGPDPKGGAADAEVFT